MNLLYSIIVPLFAAADAAAPAGNAPGGGNPGPAEGQSYLPFAVIAIIVLGYFLLWAPEKKRQRAYKDQLSAIKKNDRVVTIGGIWGVVANINREADKITLKVDENTRIDFTLAAISRVVSAENQGKGSEPSKS